MKLLMPSASEDFMRFYFEDYLQKSADILENDGIYSIMSKESDDILNFLNAVFLLSTKVFNVKHPKKDGIDFGKHVEFINLINKNLQDFTLKLSTSRLIDLSKQIFNFEFDEKISHQRGKDFHSAFFKEQEDAYILDFSNFNTDPTDSSDTGFFRYIATEFNFKKHNLRLSLLDSFSQWNNVEKSDWQEISAAESHDLLSALMHEHIDYNGIRNSNMKLKNAQRAAQQFLSFFSKPDVYFYTDVSNTKQPYGSPGNNLSYYYDIIGGSKSASWIALCPTFLVSVSINWGFWSE